MHHQNEVPKRREALIAKREHLQSDPGTLKGQELIKEFDGVLWYGMVDQVRGIRNGKLRFIFKGRTRIDEF